MTFLIGYAAKFDGPTLTRIAASRDVEYIEPDAIVSNSL